MHAAGKPSTARHHHQSSFSFGYDPAAEPPATPKGLCGRYLHARGTVPKRPSLAGRRTYAKESSYNIISNDGAPDEVRFKNLQPPSSPQLLTDEPVSSPVRPSIRQLQRTGGESSISLAGAGPSFSQASIRTLQSPGGYASIDLAGGGEVKKYFERRPSQSPGGDSSFSFEDDGGVSTSQRRSAQPVGGRSSISFGSLPERLPQPVARLVQAVQLVAAPEQIEEDGKEEEKKEEDLEKMVEDDFPASIEKLSVDMDHTGSDGSSIVEHVLPSPPASISSSPTPAIRRMNHESTIVFGDDGPNEFDRATSRRKGRRALAPPGGGYSNIFG
ncbi:hypothetical protein HK101_007956 [Irineochytrium annulatum]|nr:hypothetical protein HK101_007956 [Irineochytrium annulatum]